MSNGYTNFRDLMSAQGWDEQRGREELYQYISDTSKAAQGFRTRFDYNELSIEELEAEAKTWEQAANQASEEEQAAEDRAVADFEATVDKCLALGAADNETAYRWAKEAAWGDADEYDRAYGDEHLEYRLGLPYGFFAQREEPALLRRQAH